MIKATAKLPRAFKADAFEAQFVTQMGNTVKAIGRDFGRTVQTWDDKPTWTHDIKRTTITLIGRWVTIADSARPADANIIYRFITRGTSIRYATMTKDFVPKTQFRVLDSGPGHPGLLYVSKRRPRPGIKGRQWEEMIGEIHLPRFKRAMEKAMADGARQSGHKY